MTEGPRDGTRRLVVGTVDEGTRLDRFLAAALPEASRSQLQRLVREGGVSVDGRPQRRPAARLPTGAEILVALPEGAGEGAAGRLVPAPGIAYGLLHEDEALWVVDKPAGLVVHPAAGHADDTLVNALIARDPAWAVAFRGSERELRPGIVHRLDRDTSGVMVVARDEATADALVAQFKARTVRKAYLAIVRGTPSPAAGLIDAPVGRDPRHRQRMRALASGRTARTAYQVLDAVADYALLMLEPETGRTHQIRVHLEALGHPVVGDPVYGRADRHIGRLALHAWRLTFRHPTREQEMTFAAAVPEDLRSALSSLDLCVPKP